MTQARLKARRPTMQEIVWPALFNEYSDAALRYLCQCSEVINLPPGSAMAPKQTPPRHLFYVISGQWQIHTGEQQHTVRAGSSRSHYPLIPADAGQARCRSLTSSMLLRISTQALSRLPQGRRQPAARPAAAEDAGLQKLKAKMLREFKQALRLGILKLPPMPDIAVRIARHVDEISATSESIARIVQMDPLLAGRLISVSNSVAFGGRGQVETTKDAVTRVGQQETRDLVIAFVLGGVFRTHSRLIREHMDSYWQLSTHIAAVCHALAKRVAGFNPAQALLMGLVHNIGVAPILTRAQKNPELLKDEALLDAVIEGLSSEFSALTLNKWGFAEEFIHAAEHATDWQRDENEALDYTDLLILSRYHVLANEVPPVDLPPITKIPAFSRLDKAMNRAKLVDVLAEAREEIHAIRQLMAH